MKPSELKISISVKSYDENTAENDRNRYVAKKTQHGRYRSQILTQSSFKS